MDKARFRGFCYTCETDAGPRHGYTLEFGAAPAIPLKLDHAGARLADGSTVKRLH